MDESSSANSIENGRFRYIHDKDKGPPEAIDVHHVIVRKNKIKGFILRLSHLPLLASPICFFFVQGKSFAVVLWSLLVIASLIGLLLRKLVEKESVIILPAFGVQLETHYGSGRTVRHFVPISKILKPVINECVTPVTCYWSLALIIRGEEELMLVFKELCPPVRMLLPVWKALCAATDIVETSAASQQFN
ncbi:hypothetical protein M9H77_05180 [Catharanthus roseus]|uniref:Uncharacterized protein n=1 Tax=Catharanthus roseus TaxID=4058 RepID=A0ACC0CGI7_CATRO|nr:hypothetical protein M9H77_05180 [Catharanthus roseus]